MNERSCSARPPEKISEWIAELLPLGIHPQTRRRRSRAFSIIVSIAVFSLVSASGESFDTLVLRTWADGWELRKTGSTLPLLRVVPDAWQGNIELFEPGTQESLGVLWPHFLMNSHKEGWLTDKVESEGMTLETFRVNSRSGQQVWFTGKWRFRDLFTADYEVICARTAQALTLVVRTRLEVINPIPNASKIWVELMNQPGAVQHAVWSEATSQTSQTREFTVGPHRHFLGDPMGFFDSIGVSRETPNTHADVALINVTHSQSAYRLVFDGNVKNVELHAKDPWTDASLQTGHTSTLAYLVVIPSNPEPLETILSLAQETILSASHHHPDQDKDGLTNPLELLAGTNFAEADAAHPLALRIDSNNTLHGFGFPGMSYQLESSTDLVNWNPVTQWGPSLSPGFWSYDFPEKESKQSFFRIQGAFPVAD